MIIIGRKVRQPLRQTEAQTNSFEICGCRCAGKTSTSFEKKKKRNENNKGKWNGDSGTRTRRTNFDKSESKGPE